MKKLMMAVAIVCAAVGANASTVAWGISDKLDTTKFASGKLYLFEGTSIANLKTWAATQTSFTYDNVKTALGNPSLLGLDGDTKGVSTADKNVLTIVDGEAKITQLAVNSFDSGSTGNAFVYAVAISDDGKNLALVGSTKRLVIKNNTSPAAAKWTGSNFTQNYTASSVPEPTSALLLLLGVAGMALRRRRA